MTTLDRSNFFLKSVSECTLWNGLFVCLPNCCFSICKGGATLANVSVRSDSQSSAVNEEFSTFFQTFFLLYTTLPRDHIEKDDTLHINHEQTYLLNQIKVEYSFKLKTIFFIDVFDFMHNFHTLFQIIFYCK